MSNIRVTELDFDEIKKNLKEYLKTQTTFNSYDYEGSALSVLLDILSYNTHYNAFLANMLANEMFLDSAVKRASIVSLAKHLGYTPRSARGAIGNISFSVTLDTPTNTYISLPKNTVFTTSIGGNSLSFYNSEEVVGERNQSTYNFISVPIKEGTVLNYDFTVVSPGPAEKYTIPNINVDTTSLVVTVQNSTSDSTTYYYQHALDVSSVNDTSRVYFLDENKQGLYEIYFGDGVFGKKLVAGNIVRVSYAICNGSLGNSTETEDITFSLSSIAGVGTVAIDSGSLVINTRPSNGADVEGVDSIKFNAPKFRSSQNRAVTANDYAAVIKASNPNIESIAVWGGEENNPPTYGKVFIAIKPTSGYIITDSVKDFIKTSVLKEKKVMSIIPELVDPDYLYVNLNVDITYDKLITSLNAAKIQSLATGAIQVYFDNELEKFNKPLSFSKLLNTIDTVNTSITSTIMSVGLQRRVTVTLNNNNQFIDSNNIKFYNRIHPNTVKSSYFFVQYAGVSTKVYLRDQASSNPPNYDGKGLIYLVRQSDDVVLNDQYGEVNYRTGDIEIPELIPTGLPTGATDIRINLSVQRASYNLATQKNLILTLDNTDTDIDKGRTSGLVVNVTAES
jgi:hypothetical protein